MTSSRVRNPFASLRNRLALLFFLVSAFAMIIVYAYVVPQLKSSLVDEKITSLESIGPVYSKPLAAVMDKHLSDAALDALVRRLERRSGSRVTLLGVKRYSQPSVVRPSSQLFVVADSRNITDATRSSYGIAQRALVTQRLASGTASVGGQEVAQVASPLRLGGSTPWIAVFSTSLADVKDNVSLIQQKIIAAGVLALLLSMFIGYLVAGATTRRVKRLEVAAEGVAAGQFTNPIPIESADEIGKLAQTFNEMQTKLRRLDAARKEFIANASHELRTPIFSLSGFVELLQDEDLDPETREEFLQTIKEQVDRLTKLATDLLDLSMIDAGSLELQNEETDLVELAQSVAKEFLPAADQHETAIKVVRPEEEVDAICDPPRVSQILRILLNNAIEHTPPGTEITVSIEGGAENASITVIDSGPGLERDQAAHVFERFFSGEAGKGTGLGLAIARELAHNMNGKLTVESEPGRTAFKLELPVE